MSLRRQRRAETASHEVRCHVHATLQGERIGPRAQVDSFGERPAEHEQYNMLRQAVHVLCLSALPLGQAYGMMHGHKCTREPSSLRYERTCDHAYEPVV